MVTCALWDIESQELDRRPRGTPNDLLSNTRDSISHREQMTILEPSYKMVATTKGFQLLRYYLNFSRLFTNEFIVLKLLMNSIEFIRELYIEFTVLDKRKQMILQWTLYIERVH